MGYVNALDNTEYILPENGALELIIQANKDQDKPYFLILDEMNLSNVERYFADFLSVMESNDTFKLHSSGVDLNIETIENGITKYANTIEVPNNIGWPKNLFVVGTVNIDETTYMFSPKVLDRANVIEFRVSEDDLKAYFDSEIPFNMDNLYIDKSKTGKGATMGMDLVKKAVDKTESRDDDLKITLKLFFSKLQEVGAEFGYRTASEIQVLFGQINKINSNLDIEELKKSGHQSLATFKIDVAIMQKLLPKLHGSRSKLADILKALAILCYCSDSVKDESLSEENKKYILERENHATVLYPISLEKIERMYKNVIQNGFTSYAEA